MKSRPGGVVLERCTLQGCTTGQDTIAILLCMARITSACFGEEWKSGERFEGDEDFEAGWRREEECLFPYEYR